MWPSHGYHKSCLQYPLRDTKDWLISMCSTIWTNMIYLNTLLVWEKAARGKLLQLSTLLHATSGHGTTTTRERSSVRADKELERKESVNRETLVFQDLNRTAVPIKYAVLKNTILLINKYLNRNFYEFITFWGARANWLSRQDAECGVQGTV
jgi:hypothetical protein